MITILPVGHNDVELFAGSSYGEMSRDDIHHMIDESVKKQHNNRYFELFAVLEEGNCVGFVSLYEHSETEISCGPETKMKYRKQGIATQGVHEALAHAKRLGFKKAVAQVRKDNLASIALHNKLGFTLCKEYTNPKGRLVLWFEKTLE